MNNGITEIRATPQFKADLRKAAERTGKTMSEYIREALASKLTEDLELEQKEG